MVQKSVPVESVVADADTGLVTTSFDDADVDLDSVLEALEDAGYEPGTPERLN